MPERPTFNDRRQGALGRIRRCEDPGACFDDRCVVGCRMADASDRLSELRAEHDRVQDQVWAARTLLVRCQAFVPPALLAEIHEFLNSKGDEGGAT